MYRCKLCPGGDDGAVLALHMLYVGSYLLSKVVVTGFCVSNLLSIELNANLLLITILVHAGDR